MEKVFLSEKNIANQTKKLITYLDLEPDQLTRETVIKCKKIIVNSMDTTFSKYGDKKPENITTVEYIDKLNKKSLSDCLKIFDNKKEMKMNKKMQPERLKETIIKKKPDTNQFGLSPNQNQYMRPDEIMGKMKNPQHPEQTKTPSKEYQSFADAGGYASFSNIDTASGPFITATGEYGLPIEMQNQNSQFSMQNTSDGKKNFADDLQRKMDALRYDGGYGGNPAMGQQGMGQQGMGQQGMGQQMSVDMLQKLMPGVDMSSMMGQQSNPNQQQNQFQQSNPNQQQIPNQQSNPMAQFTQLSQMMNQMQQSGQVNPQMMQMIMSQMQMLMSQMQGNQMQGNQMQGNQMQGNQMQGNQMQGNQMQGNQMGGNVPQQNQPVPRQGTEFDYSFSSGGENIGNDFNAAYFDETTKGKSGGYEGIDSLNSVFQHNSITEPVKNLSEQSSDLGNALEQMKAERDKVNSSLGNIQKPASFDPMMSPSQMANNQGQNQQYKDNFFF
jgi:hypothetical protein